MRIFSKNTCPSRQTLAEFTRGRLDTALYEQVAEHVTNCPRCTETLHLLADVGDTFAEHLRGPSKLLNRGQFVVWGPQCDIGDQNWGSLYGQMTGGMIKAAPRDKVAAVLKPGDFNNYSIRCVGKHVTIQVNGVTTADDDFPNLPSEGIIAWAIHGGNPMEVTFRNVEICDLSQP